MRWAQSRAWLGYSNSRWMGPKSSYPNITLSLHHGTSNISTILLDRHGLNIRDFSNNDSDQSSGSNAFDHVLSKSKQIFLRQNLSSLRSQEVYLKNLDRSYNCSALEHLITFDKRHPELHQKFSAMLREHKKSLANSVLNLENTSRKCGGSDDEKYLKE